MARRGWPALFLFLGGFLRLRRRLRLRLHDQMARHLNVGDAQRLRETRRSSDGATDAAAAIVVVTAILL